MVGRENKGRSLDKIPFWQGRTKLSYIGPDTRPTTTRANDRRAMRRTPASGKKHRLKKQ